MSTNSGGSFLLYLCIKKQNHVISFSTNPHIPQKFSEIIGCLQRVGLGDGGDKTGGGGRGAGGVFFHMRNDDWGTFLLTNSIRD